MTLGYGISGIGNPLGTLGLGAMGTYGSYDSYMPSMLGMGGMGMNSSIFGMGGMGGMMSYYPQYMTQMQQAQNQMEIMQAQHAGNMHNVLLNNEVMAHRETDSALMSKSLTNGDVKAGIDRLYAKVVEGDQNGICEQFDLLKDAVIRTYSDEFKARGDKINIDQAATRRIEELYANIISAQTGKIHNLETDIKRYGDNAFANGFLQGFRKDHHSRYIDETLNHCFGLQIDQKGSKDFKQGIGYYLGLGANSLEKGALGAVGGFTLAGLVGGGGAKIFGNSFLKNFGKFGKWGAIAGGLAGVVGGLLWKYSDIEAA